MTRPNFDVLMQIPMFEQMIATLKDKGKFEAQLGSGEFKTVIDQLMGVMLNSPDFAKLGIKLSNQPQTIVNIKPENIGAVYGKVGVASPISADIQMWADFANGQKPHEIVLAKCVTQTNTMIPFVGGKIDTEVKKALASPNWAIFNAMKTVVEPQGIGLTGISLHFAEQKLQLALGGKPIGK